MQAYFRTVNGLRIRYFSAGSGPLLVLVHPVGYPAEIFARNIEKLATEFTVVAPDLPGQGHSGAPQQWPTAPQNLMSDVVCALATDLGFDEFSIAGSSLGGLIAALAAYRHPTQVKHLIVIGSGSVFNEPKGQPAILQQVMANGSRAYAEPSINSCRVRIANTCFHPPSADDIHLAHVTSYALPGAVDAYQAIIQGLSESIGDPNASVFPHLEKISARTLVIVGREDKRTSYEAHAKGVLRIPDAQIVSFAACGHLPFLEYPEHFNQTVLDFIAGVDVGIRKPDLTTFG